MPRLPAALLPVTLALVGAAWRLWLAGRYAGWEESDYGDLAMVRGVLDARFLHYDMNHMPGYYALCAVVLAVVGDTVLAAKGVSLVSGCVALGLAVALCQRLAGAGVAAAAGLLLTIQPEFALYASSSLREPLYAAYVLGALLALSRERLVLAGLLAALAFSVRFDGMLALGPPLLLHALGRPGRLRRVTRLFGPLVAAVVAWSIYCRIDHGTFLFWSHTVAVNVETGLSGEAESPLQKLANGVSVAAQLMGWILPWRIGWGVWLGLGLTWLATPWMRHGLARTWSALALCMLGVWAGTGLVGQHEPSHNLYWKWLCPIVPVIVPLGVMGLVRLLAAVRGPPLVMAALAALIAAQAGWSNLKETRRQWARAEEWYRPQLDLAIWFEEEVPEEVPVLLDNIPSCWINRRPHERRMISWFDIPTPPGDGEAFGAWLAEEGVGWVLWFREDWTQAPHFAPFLAEGGSWSGGGVTLVETSREDGYGWILYRVEGEGG